MSVAPIIETGPMDIAGRVVIYSIVGCPHCRQAKSTLQELRLPFTEVSVDRFPAEVREWLRERSGKSSVPQIFFNNTHIGGNDDLQALVKDQARFDKLLRDLKDNPPPEGDKAPLLPHPGEAVDIPSIDGEKFQCERDEYANLIHEMRRAGVVRTHRKGWLCCKKEIKDSFTGKDFVDWIVDKKLISRERAVFMGKQLISRRFGVNVDEQLEFRDDPNALYKLGTSDAGKALNTSELSECVQRPAGEVAEDLRKLILKLYGDFLSPDGKYVDYKGIQNSKTFDAYKRMTLELQRVNLEKLSLKERVAFFINIYNALVIHGNVIKGTPSNNWQRYKFFQYTAYNIGGRIFSLNDIENGILRANRSSIGTLYMTPFAKDDPRLALALDQPEPRIHFALNCGAKSCPPIKTFSGTNLDNELSSATESFLESDEAMKVDIENKTVHLSMLFKWYQADFGQDKEDVLKWIYDRLGDEEKKKTLGELMQATCEEADLNVKYITYDWGHNEKK